MNFKARFIPSGAVLLTLTLALCSSPPEQQIPDGAPVRASDSAGAAKIVKQTIAMAQQGNTEGAMKNVGVEQMSRYLLGAEYDNVTPEQQSRFQKLIYEFVSLRGLPQAIERLGDRDPETIEFAAARQDGNRILLPSKLPGTTLSITWILEKVGRRFVITDFLDPRGNSSMQRTRDKQIQPLYRRKGMEGLLTTLDKAMARLR